MHNEGTNSIKKIRETFWADILGTPYSNKDSYRIGEGGNACVYKITKQNGEQVVLKELKSGFCDSEKNKIKFSEKIQRFRDEIITMQNLKSEQGVMPIIDINLEGLCYTMPVATPIMDFFKPMYDLCSKEMEYARSATKKVKPNSEKYGEIQREEHLKILKLNTEYTKSVVACILRFVNALINIHSKGYSHRDIKPDNLYYYNNDFVCGDFGLVDFPEKANITTSERDLGAHFTIAPEMKRNPDSAEGKIADVYSLAKTFWILLTRDEKCFDGQYNFMDSKHNLGEKQSVLKYVHLVEIHSLLESATTNDPDSRITLYDFKKSLEIWLETINSYHLMCVSNWKFITKFLFKDTVSRTTIWDRLDDIIYILNFLSKISTNFIFAGPGGREVFKFVSKANEEGYIYIHQDDSSHQDYDTHKTDIIVKPKLLVFENFQDNISCNYFMLETEKSNFIHYNSEYKFEELVEDTPGHYVYVGNPIYGVYDYDKGNKLPDGYRIVHRYFDGNFVFYSEVLTDDRIFYDRLMKVNQNPFYKFRECVVIKMHGGDISQFISDDYHKLFDSNATETTIPNIEIHSFSDSDRENELIEKISVPFEPSENNNSKIKYIFSTTKGLRMIDLLQAYYILLKEGSFRMVKRGNVLLDNTILVAFTKNEADKIKEFVSKQINYTVDIILHRVAKPSHLFTEEEIKDEMIKADDRKYNTLVIDEDGYAKVVEGRNQGQFYPASSDPWSPGNVYVGKYRQVWTDLHLLYEDILVAWYEHLKDGEHHHHYDLYEDSSSVGFESIEDLKNEVLKYY